MKNKLLSMLSILILMLCLLAAASLSAFAAGEDTATAATSEATIIAQGSCGADGDNVLWKLDSSGTLTVYGTGAMADFDQLTSPWNEHYRKITAVVVENGVTYIGTHSFRNLFYMKTAIMADSVEAMGAYAFIANNNLESVKLSSGLKRIAPYVFYNCPSLTSIVIPKGVTELTKSAFGECDELTSVTLPNTLVHIRADVFSYCVKLSDVHYIGTEEQWRSVNISSGNTYMEEAVHCCTEKAKIEGTCQGAGIESGWYCETCAKYLEGGNAIAMNPDNHVYNDNGFCPCGAYEEPELKNGYYQLKNAGSLIWFEKHINTVDRTANAVLTANIDLENRPWTPIGTTANPYSGHFDGQGYKISGLYITASFGTEAGQIDGSAGLFGNIKEAGIRNLGVNGKINCSVSGMGKGLLVGTMTDSIVYDCHVTGEVSGSGQYTGGLVGVAFHSIIINCSSSANVSDTGYYIGGLVGAMTAGYAIPLCLLNSYCTGNVTFALTTTPTNAPYVGGLVGYLNDDAVNNWFGGTVTNNTRLDNNNPATADTGLLFGYISNTIADTDPGSETVEKTFTPVIEKNYYSGTAFKAIGLAVDGLDTTGYTETYSSYADLIIKLNGNLSVVDEIIEGHRGYLSTTEWANLVAPLNGENVRAFHWGLFFFPFQCEEHNNYNDKGFCTYCGTAYEPAKLNAEGYYEIANAGQLFWFANYINTVDRTANAVLTADIDLERRPWTPIGSTSENSNNFRGVFDGQGHTITGLYVEGGRAGLGFFGEVRTGTVKNFTIYGDVVVNTEVNYVGGVIGSACGLNGSNDLERNGAIIQNITSYVNLTAKTHGVGMIGGFVGYANHQSLIENCSWYGTFDAGIYRVDSGAGGFIGKIQENTSEVTIRNCGAYGTIKTNYAGDYNNTATIYMGGFLSFSNTDAKTTLENCLFAGRFERGENLTDQAFLGAFGTLRSVNAIKNCYYLGDDGLAAVHSDSDLKPGSDNVEITSVTGEQLKSGKIAYLLQEANDIWGQTINSQNYPVLGGAKVYYGYDSCADDAALGYTNYANASNTKPSHSTGAEGDKEATCASKAFCSVCKSYYGEVDHNNHDETVTYENGVCPNCGVYEPAVIHGDVYEISNAGQLYWFARQVNSGNTAINGKLTDNIVINPGTFTSDGTYIPKNSETARVWTPIGNANNLYIGSFDGNGKTISGVYYNYSSAEDVGLFGAVGEGGTVQNVGVADSYVCGKYNVGGVVGSNDGTVKSCTNSGIVSGTNYDTGGIVGDNTSGTVTGCYNSGEVSGLLRTGGIVGYISTGTVTACINSGKVSSINNYCGGIVGYNFGGSVTDCYNSGKVIGYRYVGGIVGFNITDTAIVTNCYYLNTAASGGIQGADAEGQAEAKTAEQFASGEVAYLLDAPFGQTIGTDDYPVLGGIQVYRLDDGTYSNIANGSVAQVGLVGYPTLQAAVDAAEGGYVKLLADVSQNAILSRDLYLDLNGHDLSGTITMGSYKLYGMDSTTDGYTYLDIGFFSCVDENGDAIIPETHFKSDITGTTKRYMAIKDHDGYSFHRFYLGITHQSLKPTTTGVGYKAVFYGDEMVIAQLDENKAFGYTLQLEERGALYAYKDRASFVSGKTVTLRIDNYDIEQFGEAVLSAKVILRLSDGTVIESTECTMTMRSMLETLNDLELSAEKLAAVKAMIEKYPIIKSWDTENLYA